MQHPSPSKIRVFSLCYNALETGTFLSFDVDELDIMSSSTSRSLVNYTLIHSKVVFSSTSIVYTSAIASIKIFSFFSSNFGVVSRRNCLHSTVRTRTIARVKAIWEGKKKGNDDRDERTQYRLNLCALIYINSIKCRYTKKKKILS